MTDRLAPLTTVLERLHDVRRYGDAYRARCPSHDGKSRSLKVCASTRDGRVLIRCFAGCEVTRVVSALGLDMRDLFGGPQRIAKPRVIHNPSPDEVRAFIATEVRRASQERIANREHSHDLAALRSADVNLARRCANLRFGLSLPPRPRFNWEGFCPLDQDPLWPTLFQRALLEVSWEWPSAGECRATIAASERAASWLRAEAFR